MPLPKSGNWRCSDLQWIDRPSVDCDLYSFLCLDWICVVVARIVWGMLGDERLIWIWKLIWVWI